MTRPSRNMDERLIQTARKMIPETGFSGLKLREVAKRAGVNLGMFHYHFKDKADFMQRVMQDVYEEFFSKISLVTLESNDPPEIKLRKAIKNLVCFVRDNRQLVLALAMDAMQGEQEIVRFLEKHFHRHIRILVQLFNECRKNGVVINIPLPISMVYMIAGVLAPNIVVGVIERIKLRPQYSALKQLIVPFLLNDRVQDARIDMALKALSPKTGATLPSILENQSSAQEWMDIEKKIVSQLTPEQLESRKGRGKRHAQTEPR